MKRKNNVKLILPAIGILLALCLSSCTIFGDQSIYEDPDYVDFSVEEVETEEVTENENFEMPFADKPFVQQAGIRIYFEDNLENYIDDAGEFVAAENGEAVYTAAHPGYADFNFSPMQAHIYVSPVAAYEKAADFAPAVIADLQRVIDGSQALGGACVPELPLGTYYQVCDHQEFVSNEKLVPFGNGSGVRFVTVHAIQDLAPVGNASLSYVFQGFTEDGNYYIKAVVELMHSQLDGVGEIPAEIHQSNDAETVDAYFAEFAEIFNTSENKFTPDLDWIDDVLNGLFISSAPVG